MKLHTLVFTHIISVVKPSTSSWQGAEFLKVFYSQDSVSIVMCILLVFRYTLSAITTSSVLAVRRNSVL